MNKTESNNLDSFNNTNIDKELIKQIKVIQDIPEDVIINFLKAAGSLSKTDFKDRFEVE